MKQDDGRRAAAQPKCRHYVDISLETYELKQRLLGELGISNNKLTELAIEALAADLERRREQSLAAE